jgi:hypothetical protein
MHRTTQPVVEIATEDLRARTLEPIGYDFGRLVYLSSLRDLSTGEYHHHGLARSYSEPVAMAALAAAHKEIFCNLALSPLEELIDQIERFVLSSAHDFARTVRVWEALEAYRVTIPSDCDPLTAALFNSNVRIAIALLKSLRSNQKEKAQCASRRRLLGR